MDTSVEAFFLPADRGRGGQRFCLLHTPAGPARGHAPAGAGGRVKGAVLYVPPFAEEMNKTRRMAALQARAFAAAGHAVLQVDLHGTGDSSGEFEEASWQGWVDDVVQAAHELQRRFPGLPLLLWSLRAGALLAAQAAARLASPVDMLLWQPVASGKQHLQQFLRLKVAGEMMAGGQKGVMDGLKQRLAQGLPVEVAGYSLAADVASGLEQATLALPGQVGRVNWLEVSSQPEPALSPASERTLAALRERGIAVEARVVAGPAFWQTTEIETAPALLDASLATVEAVPVEAVAA